MLLLLLFFFRMLDIWIEEKRDKQTDDNIKKQKFWVISIAMATKRERCFLLFRLLPRLKRNEAADTCIDRYLLLSFLILDINQNNVCLWSKDGSYRFMNINSMRCDIYCRRKGLSLFWLRYEFNERKDDRWSLLLYIHW